MADDETVGLREEPDSGRGWGAVLGRLLITVLVLGALYGGAAWWLQDRPPAGMTVHGVDVGTLDSDTVHDKVQAEVDELTARPLRVSVVPEGLPEDQKKAETQELLVVPEKAGLGVDVDATLTGLTGFTLDPRELWARLAGRPQEVPLRPTVDRAALVAELERQAQDYDTEAVEGDVRLTDQGVEVTEAEDGRALDVEATADAIVKAWPDADEITGTVTAAKPLLTPEEVERFTTEELEPALAEPVVVTASRGSGDGAKKATTTLSRSDLAKVVEVERGEDHTLSLALDKKAFLARVREDLGPLEVVPKDPTVTLVGDDVKVAKGRSGAELPEKKIVSGVESALAATDTKKRTVTVTLKPVEPGITNAEAEGWTFSEMSSFESVFPGGEANAERTQNLHAGIDHLNGDVIMPGEQFSLHAALSPVTAEAGYAEAPIIVEGRLVKGIGGGLSQVSTTVLNASWEAGVQLDEHTPHSFYISRYPAGREATVAIPGVDNRWTNDTGTPVVIRAWITGETIHMRFLGDRQYEVRTIEGPRSNVQQPQTITDDSPECVTQHASEGFDITVTRELLKDGQVVQSTPYTTHYIPEDEVICTHPEAD